MTTDKTGALEALKTAIRGEVVLATDAGYEQARSI
jgi:hypothetical protein